MKSAKYYLPFVSLLFLPALASAQAMSVFGGSEQARDCFMNANLAGDLPSVTRNMLEPCDYALEFSDLSLSDRAATFANRGILLVAQGKLDAAMQDYEKATSLMPDKAEIYVNRGNAYFLNRDYSMALKDYEKSMDLGIRQLHFVHYNMGITYEKLGNKTAAEKEFRSALDIEPGWAVAQNRLDRLLGADSTSN